MDDHFEKCVESGMNAQGIPGSLKSLHVTHVGILGDTNHSSTSLHSEARAIDVDAFELETSNGSHSLVYKKQVNQPFIKAFRKCWGKAVNKYNGCPLINGKPLLTGSIGKEDSNHQNHMHVSIPYCVNGSYGPGYKKR